MSESSHQDALSQFRRQIDELQATVRAHDIALRLALHRLNSDGLLGHDWRTTIYETADDLEFGEEDLPSRDRLTQRDKDQLVKIATTLRRFAMDNGSPASPSLQIIDGGLKDS